MRIHFSLPFICAFLQEKHTYNLTSILKSSNIWCIPISKKSIKLKKRGGKKSIQPRRPHQAVALSSRCVLRPSLPLDYKLVIVEFTQILNPILPVFRLSNQANWPVTDPSKEVALWDNQCYSLHLSQPIYDVLSKPFSFFFTLNSTQYSNCIKE